MLGSGGMARTHMQAFTRVRKIKKLQVFSPTNENRERFGREMAAKYNIEVRSATGPRTSTRAPHRGGAHRFRGRGDRRQPAREGHPYRRGRRHAASRTTRACKRVDVYLRFGDTPAPVGHPELATDAEHIGYEARPQQGKHGDGRRGRRKHGNSLPDQRVTLADLAPARRRGAPRPTRSPIRSAAICRAPSSTRSPARSTSWRSAPASAARFRPNGFCRTSATDRTDRVCFVRTEHVQNV